MSNRWVSTHFGDLAKLVKGVSYASEDYCGPDEGRIFITIKCVSKEGGFKREGVKYFKGALTASQFIETGDLLIANTDLTRAGDIIGAPVVVPFFDSGRVTMSMDLSKVVEDREKVDRQFLSYLLMTDHARRFMKDHASGSTVLHLQTRAVPKLSLTIPTETDEQSKIAEVLSTVDRAIAQTEALIAKQQRIKTGLMQNLLTRGIDEHGQLRMEATHAFKDSPLGRIPVEWEVRRVGEVFHIQLGKMLSKLASTGRSSYPYLGNKNVQWDHVDTSGMQLMDFNPSERVRFSLKYGDVLVCEGGEVGRTCLWRSEIDNCFYQKAIHRLRPTESYLPELFPRFMRWCVRHGILSNFTSQTSIAHLTKEKLADVPMTVPSVAEQKLLCGVLDEMDSTIHVYSAEQHKLQALKTALMQDLLTGRVRVTPLLQSAGEATA